MTDGRRRRAVRALARRWLPYWLAAAGFFAATAALGAAVGAERASPVVPVRGPGDPVPDLEAGALFLHNARVAGMLAGGVALLGNPTVYVLGLNGFLFGATMADVAASLGPLTALAVVVPHGVIELPALWLAGAVGLRWVRVLWGIASGSGAGTSVPRTVADSLVAVLAVLLALAVAAVIEAGPTLALARALA